jgi:hypothetical protein
MLLIAGIGFTVTVTVKSLPVHPPAKGVTVYIAIWVVLVGLVRVPLMFAAAVPAAPPVIPPVTEGAAQVYVVVPGTMPLTPSAGAAMKLPALHIVAVIFVTAGFGLTVTVTVNVAPVQLPDFGVTVYVAVATLFVGLVRVPPIAAAFEPAVPPVIPPVTEGAAHEYNVPDGTIPFVTSTGAVVKLPALQIVAVIFKTAGTGFTRTVTVNVAPVHVPVTGVTVYVAVWNVLVGLTRVLLMFTAAAPVVPPVIPPVTTGSGQL